MDKKIKFKLVTKLTKFNRETSIEFVLHSSRAVSEFKDLEHPLMVVDVVFSELDVTLFRFVNCFIGAWKSELTQEEHEFGKLLAQEYNLLEKYPDAVVSFYVEPGVL